MALMVNIIEYYDIVSLAKDEQMTPTHIANRLGCSKMDAIRKIKYAEKHLNSTDEVKGYKRYEKVLDLTFGQFLSIETMLSSATDFKSKMLHILSCILRPKDEVIFDNEDAVREDEHNKRLLQEPFYKLIAPLNNFLEDRDTFHFESFKDVFYDSDSGKEAVGDDEQEDEAPKDYSFERKWYWVQILDMLSGEDAHKWDDSLNMKMSTAAPFIAYRVSKAKKEWAEANRRDQEMKARSRR